MQNAQKLATYLAESVTDVVGSLEDGLQPMDALTILAIIGKKPEFKTVLPLAKQEIVVATPEQILALKQTFREKFDLKNDKVEARVERVFNIGIETILLIEGV